MTRIRLRKVNYAACYNFVTEKPQYPAAFYTGYVVTGLIGSDDFYIPRTYNGLNIIGITWQAYTTLPEYKSGSTSYSYTSCYPNLYFHNNTLLFIMFPKRNSETTRVFPSYYVDTLNGCYRYRISAMTWNKNESLLSYLLENISYPYNKGYSCVGDLVIEKWQGTRHFKATPALGMYSSIDALNRAKMGLNYFEDPFIEWHEIRDVMQRELVVAAHCRIDYHPGTKQLHAIPFAYNIIDGYDVEIDSSRPDSPVSQYYMQNKSY